MTELAAEILETDTSKPGAEELLLEYSRHEEMMVRSNALEMLWDFDSEGVVKRMGEVLDDEEEDELVVVEALEWVGLNEREDFYQVVTKLLDDPADLVRAFAALALIDIGSEADVPMLEERLGKAPDEDKQALLFVLAHLGDADRYVDKYFALLEHGDWLTRRAVASNSSILAEIVDPQLVQNRLEEAFETETHAGVKHDIRDSLKEIAELN